MGRAGMKCGKMPKQGHGEDKFARHRPIETPEYWLKQWEREQYKKDHPTPTPYELEQAKKARRHTPTLENFRWSDWKGELIILLTILGFFFVRLWFALYH